MTAPRPPIAATVAALTPAQVRAIRLLGYPSWTRPELLTGVRGDTLRILGRLGLVAHHHPNLPGSAARRFCSWRLTQRGARVKAAMKS